MIAGVNGVDPLRDMRLFLEELRRIGISGVHNFPTVAWFDGEFRRTLEATGLGYSHEIACCNAARELGHARPIGYAFNEDDTKRLMDEAAPDIFIFHAGITGGGATGDAAAASHRGHGRAKQDAFRYRTCDQAGRDPACAWRGDR